MANQFIYGRRPVAEAERGRRRVHRIWRAPEASTEELERLCGSPDHQGVVAEVDPYPYGDARGMLRDGALLIALDQVQDPRNLGAVCRSAEFAGAAGVVIPERRSAAITPATCKASAGAGLLDLGRRRRSHPSPLVHRSDWLHHPGLRRRGQRPEATRGR
jgi:23S rRNA (guanosine2251-2'-O)-methyltransferase